MAKTPNQTAPVSPRDSVSGCLARLAWMLFGNVALFLCAVFIALHTKTFLSALDAAFWGVVALMVAIRHVDIQRFKGQTATSEPATMAHWRRYAMVLVIVALVAWAAAYVIARLSV